MRKTERQIELMKRLDYLIRLGETGTPKQLAKRLAISKASLLQAISIMKQDNTILFDIALQSYVYQGSINSIYGIYKEKVLEVSHNSAPSTIIHNNFKYPSLRIV